MATKTDAGATRCIVPGPIIGAADAAVHGRAATDRQLDELLDTCWWPPRSAIGAYCVGSPAELPLALEQCIQLLSPDDLWRAYSDGVRVSLVTARPVPPASREPAAVALELRFFGNDGSTCAVGIWQRSRGTYWSLEAVLDVSAAPGRHRPKLSGPRRLE